MTDLQLAARVKQLEDAAALAMEAIDAIASDVFQTGRVSGRSQRLGYDAREKLATALSSAPTEYGRRLREARDEG